MNEQQLNVLFVIGQLGPIWAAEVASHLLSADQRSRIASLEQRGLVGRQYTGAYLSGGARVGYVLSDAGRAALEAADVDDDYDPLDW